jgi:hypothetical protein
MFDKGIFNLRSHQNWEQSGSIAQNLVEEKKLISEPKSNLLLQNQNNLR